MAIIIRNGKIRVTVLKTAVMAIYLPPTSKGRTNERLLYFAKVEILGTQPCPSSIKPSFESYQLDVIAYMYS